MSCSSGLRRARTSRVPQANGPRGHVRLPSAYPLRAEGLVQGVEECHREVLRRSSWDGAWCCRRCPAWLPDRAMCSSLRSRLQQFAEFGIGSWRRCPAMPWVPCPQNQAVGRAMLEDRGSVSATVPLGIFQLDTDLAERLTFPCHRGGRQSPVGVPGYQARATPSLS